MYLNPKWRLKFDRSCLIVTSFVQYITIHRGGAKVCHKLTQYISTYARGPSRDGKLQRTFKSGVQDQTESSRGGVSSLFLVTSLPADPQSGLSSKACQRPPSFSLPTPNLYSPFNTWLNWKSNELYTFRITHHSQILPPWPPFIVGTQLALSRKLAPCQPHFFSKFNRAQNQLQCLIIRRPTPRQAVGHRPRHRL